MKGFGQPRPIQQVLSDPEKKQKYDRYGEDPALGARCWDG